MALSAAAENLEDNPDVAGVVEFPQFREIYEQHVDLVWRTLRRYGVPEASLADATQEVFIVVHSRLASFEGRSSLRSWVFGIARRVARNHRTKNSDVGIDEQQLNAIADLPCRSPQLGMPTPLRLCQQEPANEWIAHFPFVWLPGFLVPVALASHILVFRALSRRASD